MTIKTLKIKNKGNFFARVRKWYAEPTPVKRVVSSRFVEVFYKPRVIKFNGHALTIRKPKEVLFGHVAYSQNTGRC